jgi:hypothetical protein
VSHFPHSWFIFFYFCGIKSIGGLLNLLYQKIFVKSQNPRKKQEQKLTKTKNQKFTKDAECGLEGFFLDLEPKK